MVPGCMVRPIVTAVQSTTLAATITIGSVVDDGISRYTWGYYNDNSNYLGTINPSPSLYGGKETRGVTVIYDEPTSRYGLQVAFLVANSTELVNFTELKVNGKSFLRSASLNYTFSNAGKTFREYSWTISEATALATLAYRDGQTAPITIT